MRHSYRKPVTYGPSCSIASHVTLNLTENRLGRKKISGANIYPTECQTPPPKPCEVLWCVFERERTSDKSNSLMVVWKRIWVVTRWTNVGNSVTVTSGDCTRGLTFYFLLKRLPLALSRHDHRSQLSISIFDVVQRLQDQ